MTRKGRKKKEKEKEEEVNKEGELNGGMLNTWKYLLGVCWLFLENTTI